jgi:hypothetical protein
VDGHSLAGRCSRPHEQASHYNHEPLASQAPAPR